MTPSALGRPYVFEVSKKLMPFSWAASMMGCAPASLVAAPKFMVPGQSLLTDTRLRPRCVYCMPFTLWQPPPGAPAPAALRRPGGGPAWPDRL